VEIRALLFDLDNTLLLEDEVTFRAVRTACERAAGRADAERLYEATLRIADDRWRAAPTSAYADRMGIWWGEGLWGEFKGDGDGLRALRDFAPQFRRDVWRDALADCGVDDADLAADLDEVYPRARRAGEIVDPEAVAVLDDLSRDHRLALVTNGSPDVQREKLGRAALAHYFAAIVISAELDVGKPDRRIFAAALDAIGIPADAAVMIGDSLPRDIGGARDAGLRSIWIDRGDVVSKSDDPMPDARVAALSQIRSCLAAWEPDAASPRGSP
jgi:putative hydrolase of the HAD superfamily